MTHPTAGLEERVKHLELENRRLRRIGVVALISLAGLFLLGQAKPRGHSFGGGSLQIGGSDRQGASRISFFA